MPGAPSAASVTVTMDAAIAQLAPGGSTASHNKRIGKWATLTLSHVKQPKASCHIVSMSTANAGAFSRRIVSASLSYPVRLMAMVAADPEEEDGLRKQVAGELLAVPEDELETMELNSFLFRVFYPKETL